MSNFKKIYNSVDGAEQWQRRTVISKYFNASFDPIFSDTLQYEGKYENQSTDAGTYVSGKIGVGAQIGSNMGVSAATLAQYLGRTPSVSDMQNLTKQQAEDIARKYYWNPIQGDAINSAAIAHATYDAGWASGGQGIKLVRQAINQVAGSNVVDATSKSMSINNTELGYLNSLDSTQLFNAILNIRNAFDNSLSGASVYGVGWKNRLDKIYNLYAGTMTNISTFVKSHKAAVIVLMVSVAAAISVGLIMSMSKTTKAATA